MYCAAIPISSMESLPACVTFRGANVLFVQAREDVETTISRISNYKVFP